MALVFTNKFVQSTISTMKPQDISLPIRKLDAVTFNDLLIRQNPFQSDICIFDLTGVQLVTPGALVQLAAACHNLGSCGKQPSIMVDNRAVRTHLVRSDFVQTMQDMVHFRPPIYFQPSIFGMLEFVHDYVQGARRPLVGITKIQSETELPNLLDRIVDILKVRLKYKSDEAHDIAIVISEICQNAYQHNTQTCGFFSMQVSRKEPNCFLEIGVADCGDGLATTLRRNPDNLSIASDEAAIYHAIKPGTSEFKDDPTRGMGLYHLLGIASKYSGSVHIRSGTASMHFRTDKKSSSVPPMPGVQIAFTLPTKRRG